MTIAIIKTGGKQYLVKEGTKIKVEKLSGNPGDMVKLETLLKADDQGQGVEIGKPMVTTTASAKIMSQGRADKVTIIKFKNKIRYRRKIGHRQPFTEIQIEKI